MLAVPARDARWPPRRSRMNLEPVIDDAVLLDGLRRGDDHAFATLVRQHAGRMLATARRLLRDGDEAEDAVKEAFVSAARAIGGLAGASQLSPWCQRASVCHHQLRWCVRGAAANEARPAH